jgi:Flp pilus assembly protein TadG
VISLYNLSRRGGKLSVLDREINRENEHGRAFVSLSIAVVATIILVGVAIDLVRAHATKTKLSKVANASALVAIRNLDRGQSKAAAAARTAFKAGSRSVPGIRSVTEPSVTWFSGAPCVAGGICVRIAADAASSTHYFRLLGFDTLRISASGTAQRTPIVMSLVLERSGPMYFNGGVTALPPAVINFISHFIVGVDHLSEVSFSSIASVDVAITASFESPITDSVERMIFAGATFAQAGLQDGFDQIQKASMPDSIRIVVFFTDGWANTINDKLNCSDAGRESSVNFGGCSPLEVATGWCSPRQMSFWDPETGRVTFCPSVFTFPAHAAPGGNLAINQVNVSNEATYRTEELAETMRAKGITIYSIGMGDRVNRGYLQAIANDPDAASYNPNEPQGVAVFAPGWDQLDQAFQAVASTILTRMSP